ncbi:MAG TPA: hypothetical protein VMH80_10845 [Bryobacteraceae bacterium]|nr:hypothetical protein [Bryobacteraceae bacterium]
MTPKPDRFRIRDIQDRIRRVLMREWDPIGVDGVAEAADEYDSYIGGIYGLISRGASAVEISAHLRKLEIDEMGMVDAQGLPFLANERRDAVASSLLKLFSE